MESEVLKKGLDVADKTIGLVNKVYDDGLSKPTKALGNGLSMCLGFLGSMVSPMMYEYIQNAEYKKKEVDRKLAAKYNLIPEDKRVEPRMNIMGPAVDVLKYNLDEEYIKEIFVNIMCSEMNTEKQDKVLPSYIDIVRQLSKNDAQMLKSIFELFKKNGKQQLVLDIVRARPNNSEYGYFDLDKYVIDYDERYGTLHTIKLDPVVIDNLSRLEIIKIDEVKYITDKDDYEIGFNYIKNIYSNFEDFKVFYEKGILELTNYGINFLSVCFE